MIGIFFKLRISLINKKLPNTKMYGRLIFKVCIVTAKCAQETCMKWNMQKCTLNIWLLTASFFVCNNCYTVVEAGLCRIQSKVSTSASALHWLCNKNSRKGFYINRSNALKIKTILDNGDKITLILLRNRLNGYLIK